jgi:O-antigen/teichoic acid export membrane protein
MTPMDRPPARLRDRSRTTIDQTRSLADSVVGSEAGNAAGAVSVAGAVSAARPAPISNSDSDSNSGIGIGIGIGIEQPPDSTAADENRSAARNGATLGASLLFTSTLGVIVSLFFVPNMVGPSNTGILGFGEALATVSLVVAGFGMDTYLRKEVSTQRGHANGFLASVLVVRLLLSLLITAFAAGILLLRHNDLSGGLDAAQADKALQTTLTIVVLYCAAQFFQQTAESFAAMLQAVGEVRQQSRLTIFTKVFWALMVIAGLSVGFGIWMVPLALLLTEMAKSVWFGWSAHKVFRFSKRIDLSSVWPIVKAASPFLVTAISVKAIAWLDVTMVKLLTGDDVETGYYTVALRISSLALLLAPLIQWVVLPLASRAAERSRTDLAELTKRSFQWVLCAGIPLSLLLCLNADLLIRVGLPDNQPAIPALRILSALIVLSYMSILAATLLVADGRSWRVVRITFLTIAIDVLMNLYMIRRGWQWWGQGDGNVRAGGAGVGAAISLVTAETVGVTCYLFELRRVFRRLSDRESRRNVGLTVVAGCIVIVIDRLFAPTVGLARPFIDVIAMVAAMTMLGVIRVEWLDLIGTKLRSVVRRSALSDSSSESAPEIESGNTV